MTVCIGAICEQDEESRIVICSDWKSETEWGGSETSDKLRFLPKGWFALMADQQNRCEELVARYETHLRELPEVTDDLQLFLEMKKPAHNQKEALINDYILQTLGVTYLDLVSPDKHFPEAIVNKRLEEISGIRLRASLILAGFIKTHQVDRQERENWPYLFVVDDSRDHEDVVRIEENFAAIGSGAYVAIPALHQRQQEDDTSLMETIYNVYEAKRLSQVVPGVGDATSMDVIYPDGTIREWSDELAARCKWLFDKLGPKLRITSKRTEEYFGTFHDSFLEPAEEDADTPKLRTKPKDTTL